MIDFDFVMAGLTTAITAQTPHTSLFRLESFIKDVVVGGRLGSLADATTTSTHT
jgi:hypothetical protein